MGFVTATPATFHASLDKAFALMLRCTTTGLWSQCSQNLTEAMEAVVHVLSCTLGDLVGEAAQRRAAAVMRKWFAVDSEFVH